MGGSSVYLQLVQLRRRFDRAVAEAWHFLCTQFVEQLPAESLQNLPSPYIYWTGWFIYTVMAGLFLAVFVSVFISQSSERFLSLTSDGMICEKVYREFSGVYLIDNRGNWEGTTDFMYTHAVYRFEINKFKGSAADFADLIDKALSAILYIGQEALNYNLGLNLVYWMMFQATADYEGFDQIMSLAGSPKTIFDKQTLAGNMNNRKGVCDVVPRISYYRSDAEIVYEYNYDAFVSSAACMDILAPTDIGYDPELSQGTFGLRVDVEAVATAAGVNLGLLSPDELQEIPGSSFTYSYRGQDFFLTRYYYPRFPGMSSLTCYGDENVDFSCAIEMGDGSIVGYPLFDHGGFSKTEPRRCECGQDYPAAVLDTCNEFRLMGGLLFFSNPDGYSLDSFFEFVFFSGYSSAAIMEKAFNATFDAANRQNARREDAAWRAAAFEFCSRAEVSNSSCGLLGFYTGGDSVAVTDYYYPVYRGFCNDSFTLPPEAQEKMKVSSPVQFTEIYLEFRNGLFEVINSSVGLAMGNLAMYVPAVVLLAGCLLALYSRCTRVQVAQTYTAQDKDDILQYFAFNLLLARDGHYQFQKTGGGSDPSASGSLVMALKDELAAHAGISRFIKKRAEEAEAPPDRPQAASAVELTELGGTAETETGEAGSGAGGSVVVSSELDDRLKSSDFIENPLFRSASKNG